MLNLTKVFYITLLLSTLLFSCISKRNSCSKKYDSPIDNIENTKLIWFLYRRCLYLKANDPQFDQDCDLILPILATSLRNYNSCESESDIPSQPNF